MKYIAMLACGFALLAAPQKNDAPERWLQTAIQAETVDGDLKSAIEQYKKIIGKAGASREVVAKALVRLGMCYERQGNGEARKQYERAVREFADQVEAVGQARERLAALSGPVGGRSGLTARQLWTDQGGETFPDQIFPSSDGRSLLFADWDSGDLAIRDLATGGIKRLGLKKSWADSGDFSEDAVYSPDQRQLAYTWFSAADKTNGLRTISLEPGAKARELVRLAKSDYVWPFAWSPDGKGIFTLIRKDKIEQIAWVSAADGSYRTLKSLEGLWPDTASLSPDGRYIAYDAFERKDSAGRDIFILAVDGRSEATAVKSPGVHSSFVWTPDGSHLIFTSNRSRNFGLYALEVQGGKAQGAPQLLKPDVGKVTLCGFVRSGSLYYLQPSGEQNVYRAELDPASGKLRTTAVPLAGTYTTNNGMSALSPDGKRVAYLATRASEKAPSWQSQPSGPGASAIVVKSFDGGFEKSFSTDLNLGWAPMWYPKGDALLLSARRQPPGTGQGFYRLDLDSGHVTRLLENQVNYYQPGAAIGQRALSGDGETAYISLDYWGPCATCRIPPGAPGADASPGGGVAAVNISTGQVKKLYETQETVKAVSVSPDDRTLAVITHAPSAGNWTNKPIPSKVVLMGADGSSPRTLFESHDLVWPGGIAWSSDGKGVLFVRAITDSDWELWRVPVNGGEPTPTGLRGQRLREIHGGPNGTVTYTAGSTWQSELWALDNLLPMLKAAR